MITSIYFLKPFRASRNEYAGNLSHAIRKSSLRFAESSAVEGQFL